MRARFRSGGLILAAAFMGAATLLALTVRTRTAGPSILLVTFDTTRADHLGCYGYDAARTPHLDSLAREGVLFEDATSPCPITLPAHASLMTGLLPPRHGLRSNEAPRPLAPRDRRPWSTAAERLSAAGYATAAFVSATPVARRTGLDAGFEVYDGPERNEAGSLLLAERDARATVDAALGFLRSRDRSRPYFLWVHLFDPHHPYAPPEGRGALPESVEGYDDEIAWADRHFGRLLGELRTEGTLDRTVVVATADHGEGLGEHGEATHGYLLHRSTLRVPLLMRFPSRIEGGMRVSEPVSLVDVLPTFMALAGRPPEEGAPPLDGAALLGGASPPTSGAPLQYAESLYAWESFRWAPACCARQGTLRSVEFGGGRREVYDLVEDPGETRDLAAAKGGAMAEVGADAWSLLASPPLLTSPDPEAMVDPALATVAYLGPAGGRHPPPFADAGKLPLPSTSLITRLQAAVRLVGRAASDGDAEAALSTQRLQDAREALEALRALDPANPAIPYWLGRAWTTEGRIVGGDSRQPWFDAFLAYRDAARLGYEDAGTISLMLQAAYMARKYQDMRTLARLAVESGLDGGTSYWCWIALAEAEAARLPDRTIPISGRAAADRALTLAEERARDAADQKRLREVRELIGR